jgi:hypothetical protein
MSHLRRVLALILIALMGWLVTYAAVGAVSASASVVSASAEGEPPYLCC